MDTSQLLDASSLYEKSSILIIINMVIFVVNSQRETFKIGRKNLICGRPWNRNLFSIIPCSSCKCGPCEVNLAAILNKIQLKGEINMLVLMHKSAEQLNLTIGDITAVVQPRVSNILSHQIGSILMMMDHGQSCS